MFWYNINLERVIYDVTYYTVSWYGVTLIKVWLVITNEKSKYLSTSGES